MALVAQATNPTVGPTIPTVKPTVKPTTQAPTVKPTTQAPTVGPTPIDPACLKDISDSKYRSDYILDSAKDIINDLLNNKTGINYQKNDLGDYIACNEIGEAEGIRGVATFCVADINSAFRIGLCLPASCEGEVAVIEEMLENIVKLKVGVTCGDNKMESWGAGAIFFMVLTSALIILIIFATLRDREIDVGDSYVTLNVEEEESTFDRVLKAFSAKRTFNELIHRSPTRKYQALDGFRGWSMLWIILGHTANFFFLIGFSNWRDFWNNQNYNSKDPVAGYWSMQFFVYSAGFAVDTFFFLSGFLSALVLYRKLEKGQRVSFPMAVFGRFLRLIPVYAFIIMAFVWVVGHLGQGPLWYLMEDTYKNCSELWYTNLLFINNFYPAVYDNQCMAWTWYLANDMQFFIIGFFIVQAFKCKKALGVSALVIICIASWVANAVITDTYDLKALDVGSSYGDFQNKIYDKPYARIVPYMFGMGTAFLICTYGKARLTVGKTAKRVMMVVALVLFGFVASWTKFAFNSIPTTEGTPIIDTWGKGWDIFYITFARTMWSVALVLMVILCTTDQGGIVERILSFSFWDPIGKLTYSAYLIHPILIRVVYFNRTTLFDYDGYMYVVHYLGFLVMAYGLATLLYCGVESPFGALVKMLTTRRK